MSREYDRYCEETERHGFWRGDAGERAMQEPLLKQGVTVGTIDAA